MGPSRIAVLSEPSLGTKMLELLAWKDTYKDTSFTIPTSADADAVAGWQDQSGNGFHVTQATGTNQPGWRTNVRNGLPVIRGDGIDDHMSNNNVVFPGSKGTIYFAGTWMAVASVRAWFDTAVDSASSRRILHGVNANTIRISRDGASGGFVDNANLGGLSAGSWIIGAARLGENSLLRINQLPDAFGSTGSDPTPSATPFRLGARMDATNYFFNHDIAVIQIWDKSHTNSQIERLRNQLNQLLTVY